MCLPRFMQSFRYNLISNKEKLIYFRNTGNELNKLNGKKVNQSRSNTEYIIVVF